MFGKRGLFRCRDCAGSDRVEKAKGKVRPRSSQQKLGPAFAEAYNGAKCACLLYTSDAADE